MRKLPTLINHHRSFQKRWIIGNWKCLLSFRTRKLKIASSFVYHDSFERARFHHARRYSLPENMERSSKKQLAKLLDKRQDAIETNCTNFSNRFNLFSDLAKDLLEMRSAINDNRIRNTVRNFHEIRRISRTEKRAD